MIRASLLLVACLALPGCFVLDELDAGREIMEKNSPQKKEEPAPEAAEAEKPPTGSDWWGSAKSLGPADEETEPGDPKAMVSCRIAGSTRFMRRGDCVSQGGAPKG